MKKTAQITIISICFLFLANVMQAQNRQESLRDRLARKQQQQQGTQTQDNRPEEPKLSVRAELMNEAQHRDLSNAAWIREVYRFLDLNKGKNAALYYPVQPVGNKMNLYTMIFKLMANGSLVGYDWNQGQDLFADDLVVDFGDVLKRLEITYQKNGNVYVFDEFSIPSNEISGYYIKEAWYFDRSNSALGVKTVALCPVLFRQRYFGDDDIDATMSGTSSREPQFWIPYEHLRPYAARMPIMTSDLNNVMNKTIDDYFRLRLYEGEIYKTTTMENKFLQEKFKTPEALKYAQDSIENQLKEFDKGLWVINDSIKAAGNMDPKKAKTKAPKSASLNASYSARDRR
ncbi:MAG: gliding motility protein GldN [Prevotella sp.]|nr:gliding motility protein GldN [Prevotella sp.]